LVSRNRASGSRKRIPFISPVYAGITSFLWNQGGANA
jgi:hypothetical protein